MELNEERAHEWRGGEGGAGDISRGETHDENRAMRPREARIPSRFPLKLEVQCRV